MFSYTLIFLELQSTKKELSLRAAIIFVFLLFCCSGYSQVTREKIEISDTSSIHGNKEITPKPKAKNKYSRITTYEYGLLINATAIADDQDRPSIAHTFNITFDFNLKSNKLFISALIGAFYAPGETGGPLLGFGFNYKWFTEGMFNLSAFAGTEVMYSGPTPGLNIFGVFQLRGSVIDKDRGFTFGIKYMPSIGMNEHWFMPTIGWQFYFK